MEGFRTYLCSETFLKGFNGLAPEHRQSVMRAHAKAEALCETKARHPLVHPRRIDVRRAEKVNWSDPAMRTKLADAYSRAGGDDEKPARILRVSLGFARLAKRRHLDSAAIGLRQSAL